MGINVLDLVNRRKKTATSIAAAIALVTPFTISEEGVKLVAYLDIVKNPTICYGHTKGVTLKDRATLDMCRDYLRTDMGQSMAAALQYSPSIVDHPTALAASGDFIYTAGPTHFKTSPMVAHFNRGDIEQGCRSFVGYVVYGQFKHKPIGLSCQQRTIHKTRQTVWMCRVPRLEARRQREAQMCLGNYKGL